MRLEPYQGQPWYMLECRRDERTVGDRTDVDRVGLDGSPQPAAAGAPTRDVFSVEYLDNCLPKVIGDWLNAFERHAVLRSGDIATSGPLRLSLEMSESIGPVLRWWFQAPTFDAKGNIAAVRPQILWQQANPAMFSRYDWRVETTSNHVGIWLAGKQVVDRNGPFGYQRPLYPEYRIYRAARTDTAKLRVLPSAAA